MDSPRQPSDGAPKNGVPDLADFGYFPNTKPTVFDAGSIWGKRGGRRTFWPSPRERRWWHYLLSAPIFTAFIWHAFILGERVPILGMVDLAVHEAGHVLFMLFPSVIMLLMGNGTQFLLPFLIGIGLAVFSKDRLGAALFVAWSGTSLQDASVYIGDAPYRALPLLSGNRNHHDWWQLLGPEHFNMLSRAEALADLVWFVGLVLCVGGALFTAYNGVVAWTGGGAHANGAGPNDGVPTPGAELRGHSALSGVNGSSSATNPPVPPPPPVPVEFMRFPTTEPEPSWTRFSSPDVTPPADTESNASPAAPQSAAPHSATPQSAAPQSRWAQSTTAPETTANPPATAAWNATGSLTGSDDHR